MLALNPRGVPNVVDVSVSQEKDIDFRLSLREPVG
jgi:hypothetical protein